MPGITSAYGRPIDRRAALAGVTALALFGGASRDTFAQQGTPVAQPTGDDDAVDLLNDAAAAMIDLDTFAFSIVTARGETTILEGLEIEEISGVVRRPTDFQTTVLVTLPFASIELTAVSVDGEVWVNLPTVGEDQGGWQSLGSGDGLLSILNPDVLILEAIPYIDNATIDREGDIDGAAVTYVTGTVDFRSIATEIIGDRGPEAALAAEIAEGPVDITIAIDDMALVREIEIIGPLLATESADVIRLVTFTDFNEPVEIEEPELDTPT